jgi:transposase
VTVVWQIHVMPRPDRPWELYAQGPDLRLVMALLSKARRAMPRRTKFTVIRTETLEAPP